MIRNFPVRICVFLFMAVVCNIPATGQTVSIFSLSDSAALSGAYLSFRSPGSEKQQLVLSDHKGTVDLSAIAGGSPLVIKINRMGYHAVQDTLSGLEGKVYYLEPTKELIEDVVVTGQYAPGTAAQSIHVVKVIGSDQIEKMAAQNLKDVLANSLNIRISQDNILGSGMSMQGVSGQNIKLLVDGVPIIGRLNGNIDISQLNMNNVERIEIVEGPLSVNYGTDALAGTINIITKKKQVKTFHIRNDNYYESNGQYNISGKVGYQKEKNTLQLSLGRNYFDGWNAGDKPFLYQREMYADTGRTHQWKPKEQIFGSLVYTRQIKDLNFYFTSDLFDENIINRGMPRAPYWEAALDDNYRTLRSSNAISLNGKINDRFQTSLIVGYNYYKRVKNTFYKDLTTLDQVLTSGSGDQDTSIFNAFMSRGTLASTRDSRLNYELGYDINYETSKGPQIKEFHQDMGDYALFATAEYVPVAHFTIKPGLRASYNSRYDAPLVPSLYMKYLIPFPGNAQARNIALRASYARGFRAPSLKELYFNFVDINHDIQGNDNLKAEHSNNFIFNVVFQRFSGRSALKLEWNNFYNNIHNMIVLAQTTPSSAMYTYANIGSYTTYGSTLNGEISFDELRFSLSGGYVSLGNQLYEADTHTDKFSITPEIRSSLSYEWKLPQISFALFYKYTGKTPGYILNADEIVQQTLLGDYHMADASVTKAFLNGKIKVAVGSKNIFDVTNITGSLNTGAHSGNSYSTPLSMGRTYFFNTIINLNYQ